jgi:formylglycine-generating enzyme required for sulfatase activity
VAGIHDGDRKRSSALVFAALSMIPSRNDGLERIANMARALLLVAVALSGCASMSTRDCALCPEMVVIPAGTAILGAAADDKFRGPDELPERRFAIRLPFAVSRYEITRDQYEAFVRATNRPVGGDCLTDRRKRGDWQYDAATTFRDPGFAQAGDHPVACVDWEEAKAYVAWLNTQTDGGYRLLSEVEWEYVARGGATQNFVYPWGNDSRQGCPFANLFDRTALATYAGMDTSGYKVFDPMDCDDGALNTSPVGSKKPNSFGVHDAIGNVQEWVEDCYSANHDVAEPGLPPAHGECARRLVKGGSWGTLAHNARIAERVAYPPTHRDDSIGIRVAKTLH